MENKKDSNIKISLIYEGEMDKIIFIFFKDRVFCWKDVNICRFHSKCIGGTIKSKDIKPSKNECCNALYIFDKDEIESKIFDKLNFDIKDKNNQCISTTPCIELIILLLINDIGEINADKKWIENKINEYLKTNNKQIKYEHEVKSLQEILKIIFKNEKDIKKIFLSNLQKIKNNKNCSTNILNFIEWIEKEKNAKNRIYK